MTMQGALALPKTVTQALFPDTDQRAWGILLAIGLFGVLGVKEIHLPFALVLVLALAAAAVAFFRPAVGPEPLLYLLVAFLPFSRLLSPPAGSTIGGLTVMNLLIVLIAVAYVRAGGIAKTPALELPPMSLPIFLFIGLSLWSLAHAATVYGPWYLREQGPHALRFIRMFVYFFLTFWVVRDRRTLKTVVAVVQMTVVMVALMALWEYLDRAGSSFTGSRVKGVVEQSNTLAALFVSYMFLLLAPWLLARKRWQSWVGLGGFLVCLRGIMVTFSRGGYFGFLVGALTACWMRSKLLFLAAVGVTGLLLANPQWLPTGVRYRLEMTVDSKDAHGYGADDGTTPRIDASAGSRTVLWGAAVDMLKEHPWRGAGQGVVQRLMPHYTEGRVGHLNAHNFFLNLAAETGVPAALCYGAVVLMGVLMTYRLYRRASDLDIKAFALGLTAGLAGLLVANITSSTMEFEEATAFLWVLLALAARATWLLDRTAPQPAGQGVG